MLCDIDYFKLYNDTYGHVTGDRCLEQVATLLNTLFKRAGDTVARYGGEEFAVVLPATNASDAGMVAEQLRRAIWERAIPHAASRTGGRLTISIGIATLASGEVITAQRLTIRADEALYAAKANGRNRVEHFVADSVQPSSASISRSH
jgi:diguanylate cyclase (GGDEF)-like protein